MTMHARLSRKIATILSAAGLDHRRRVAGQCPTRSRRRRPRRFRRSRMRLVSFRDLNLNLIAHRKILDDRVGNAVTDVCDVGSGIR